MDDRQKYLEYLVSQGEGQKLDFKYNISDSRKIARSLVAFANSSGGSLLIGVRDNGSFTGIMSEEELYMIEAASNMYCKPFIPFQTEEYGIQNKTILEVIVEESNEKPHFAQHDDGKWFAYIRQDDQNILANSVMLKVWQRKKSTAGTYVRYKREEEFLLHFLEEKPFITLSHFCNIMKISRHKAEKVLVNLICLGILKINIIDGKFSYSMK